MSLTAMSAMSYGQWTENFDADTNLPAGWAVINDGDAAQEWVVSGDIYNGAHSGDNAASIKYSSAAHDDYLITKEIVVQAGVSDRLSFWVKNRSTTFIDEYTTLLSTTDQAKASFTVELEGSYGPSDQWEKKEFDLTPYVGQTVYVALKATSTDKYFLYADDFVVDALPSCMKPTNVAVADITTNSANISWTAGGAETAWNIEYGPKGFTQGSGTVVNTTTNPHALSGLNPGTDYDVYVQADCGATDGQSDWTTQAVTFTTPCEAYANTYCMDFENAEAPAVWNESNAPNCWSMVDAGAGYVKVSTSFANGGTKGYQLSNSDDATGDYMLISPETTNLSDGNHQVKFFARYGYSDATVIFGTMTDPADASTFTALETITLTDSFTAHVVQIPAGADKHFAFKHGLGGTYKSVYLDDICFEEKPTTVPDCAENVTATPDAACGNFATEITWEAPATGNVDGYKLSIGTTAGGTDVLNAQDLGLVTSYAHEGNAGTTYYYTVVAYNGVGDSTGCTEMNYTTAADGCFCESVPASKDGTGIANTKVKETDLAGSDTTYQDHTATPVDVEQGEEVTVVVTTDTGSWNYHVALYVDWNDNMTFEASEKMFTGQCASNSYTGTFTVPADAVVGEHRFRLLSDYTATDLDNPCNSSDWGMTVDGKLNVTESLSTVDVGMAKNDTVLYPNPFQDVVRIDNIKDVVAIHVLDASGRLVKSFKPQNELNLGGLNSGMYMINLSYKDGSVKPFKAIKK